MISRSSWSWINNNNNKNWNRQKEVRKVFSSNNRKSPKYKKKKDEDEEGGSGKRNKRMVWYFEGIFNLPCFGFTKVILYFINEINQKKKKICTFYHQPIACSCWLPSTKMILSIFFTSFFILTSSPPHTQQMNVRSKKNVSCSLISLKDVPCSRRAITLFFISLSLSCCLSRNCFKVLLPLLFLYLFFAIENNFYFMLSIRVMLAIWGISTTMNLPAEVFFNNPQLVLGCYSFNNFLSLFSNNCRYVTIF